jgi:hypothetical protein
MIKKKFRQKSIDASLACVLSIPSLSINSLIHPLVKQFVQKLDPKYNVRILINKLK